jgi:broad specificity phosphatase PhoE
MKQFTTIYLIRHGQAESNLHADEPPAFHKKWGELESPLTVLGREQAEMRAKELQNIPFAAVLSSDLTRAVQTAEIITLEKKLMVQTTKLIRETKNWGYVHELSFQKKSREDIKEVMKRELKELDEKGKMAYKYHEEMESADEAVSRLLTFLREISVAYEGETVLVVNHGTNIRSLLTHFGYATFDELPDGSLENTAYVILESDGVNFFIKKTVGVSKQIGSYRTL